MSNFVFIYSTIKLMVSMIDPYPKVTEMGVTIDNFKDKFPKFRNAQGKNYWAREEFYKGTNMLMMGMDKERDNLYFHPNEAVVERIRTWPTQTRLRSAAAQLLVNEYQCAYKDMVECYGVGVQQLVGVKKHPYMVGSGATWMEHEGAECCTKLVSKIEDTLGGKGWCEDIAVQWHHYADEVDEMKKLISHCYTRTHVMKKWRVSRARMIKEYNRLKAILRLNGYNMEERREWLYDTPF